MNRALAVANLVVVAVVCMAGLAMAEQSCLDWLDQGDGTSWTTCVGDDGVQRCYRISNTPGSTAYQVPCSE